MQFRITCPTLEETVEALCPQLECMDKNMLAAISVLKRVAMTMWWVANVASFHLVSEQFMVGQSTVAEVAIKVCLVMEKELLQRTVHLGYVVMVDAMTASRYR